MKTSSRFYSSLGLLILLNVIIKPVWIFGIDRQVQNEVGTTAYGTYFSLYGFSILFSFLLDWGFTSFFNTKLAEAKEDFSNHLQRFLLIKLGFIFLYLVVVYAAALVAGMDRWDILHLVVAIQVLTSLFVFVRSIITAHQWFSTDAWLSVLDKTLMILFCGSLLYFPVFKWSLSINSFLWIQVLCTSVAIAAAVMILINKGVRFVSQDQWSARPVFKAALPFAIVVFLMCVHTRADGFLLERRNEEGAYQAGVYAASFRLLDAANMVGYLLASFLLPYIARHWKKSDDITAVILNSRHLLVLYSISIVIFVYFQSAWITQLLYHHNNYDFTEVLTWCLPALIGYSLVQVYGTALTGTGLIIPFCYINLAAMLLNLLLNWLLIPSYGAIGSCIAAIASQWLCGLACMFYFHQKTGTNIHIRSLLMYIFIAGLLGLYFYLVRDWPVSKWIIMLLAGLITLVAAIAGRLFTIRNWIKLYQERNSS